MREQGPVLQTGHGLQDAHGELAAEGGLVQPVESSGPTAQDARRKCAVRLLRRLPAALRAPQPPGVEQIREEHLHQVRVARGALRQPAQDVRRYPLGRHLQTCPGQDVHLRLVQRAQLPYQRGVPLLGRADEVEGRAGFRAQRAQQQDRQVPQVVHDVLDDREGLRVAVVQVLQQHHAAGVPAQYRQQPQQRLSQFDDGLGVAGGRGRAPLRHESRQRRVVGRQFRVRGGAGRPEVGREGLHQGTERYDQTGRAGPPAQHRHVQPVGPVGAFTDQPGLADPRLAEEEQRAPRTPSHGVQGAAQQDDLVVPPHDDRRSGSHARRLLEPWRARQ